MFRTETDLSDDAWTKDLVNMLPAVMNQDDDSNNQRILAIIGKIVLRHKNDLLMMSELYDIDKATGGILTDIAADWGVDRVDNDDDFLRFMLRLAILKNRLGNSMNGLKTLIATSLDIKASQFDIVPTDNLEEMKIVNIPFNFASGSDRTRKVKLFEQTFQDVLPVEWNLSEIQYSTQSSATIYVGAVAQHQHKTHSKLLTARFNRINTSVCVGVITQTLRTTHPVLIERS